MKRRRLGHAFSDEVSKVNRRYGHFSNPKDIFWQDSFLPNYKKTQEGADISVWRLVGMGGVSIILFFLLFVRLFHLQVVEGSANKQRADSNRIQIRVVHAPRGVIYDRNGKVLAENNPGFRLKGKFISRDEALKLEGSNDPNLHELEIDTIRSYPDGERFSHLLGYTGEVTEDELKDPLFAYYRLGDRIGRSGIESSYEKFLKGKDGAEILELDSIGKKIRTMRRVEPIPGNNIYLSVDATLQESAYKSLSEGVKKAKSCCGVVIAQDPQNGEILALVSYPSFNSNSFNDPTKNSEVSGYFTNQDNPLLNRAIAGTYPPGSTFKIASALAGLSSGLITPETIYEDTGVMRLGPYSFSNWFFTQHGRTEGPVDIVKALQRSNDIYFYQVGNKIGVDQMAQAAKKLGFGRKSGIDIPGEVEGLVPDGDWKEDNIGEVWYPGDNLHMAIGQGYLLSTPIQVLTQTSLIASMGKLYQPHLVTKITSPQGQVVKEFKYNSNPKDIFDPKHISIVRSALELVPKAGGTAWPFFNFSIPTAGKTGTAEFGDPKDRTHAWYTSFAPVNDPKIVLTVLVEAGGEGSSVAGPISKEIYMQYFNAKDREPLPVEEVKILGE